MSLFSSLSVSASGMAAQRTRAELLVENLANAETTRTPEGGPVSPQRRRVRRGLVASRSVPNSTPRSDPASSGVKVGDTDRRQPRARIAATCPDIPMPTRTATSRSRRSIRPKTWST